jgi:hypothetical protein
LRAGRPRRSRARSVATAAVFVALAVALGHLLAYVPNVELVTFTVFGAGVALGKWRGAAVGATAMALYSGFSPFGSGLAIPPLFAAQIAAMAVAGFVGGASAPFWSAAHRGHGVRAAVGGTLGFVVTLAYQCAVVVGLAVATPEFRTGVLAAVLANAFFSGVHLTGNTLLFSVLGPTVLPKLGRLAGAAGEERASGGPPGAGAQR